MARPPSWLERAPAIRKRVEDSPVTHYCAGDLSKLFQLMPRQAREIRELMPTVMIGPDPWVEKEDLLSFLDQVRDAADVNVLFRQMRAEKVSSSRRRPRKLSRRQFEPIDPKSLGTWLSPGLLEVRFLKIEQLADVLWRIACCCQEEKTLEELVRLYEPAPLPDAHQPTAEDAEAVKRMFAELDAMEGAHG